MPQTDAPWSVIFLRPQREPAFEKWCLEHSIYCEVLRQRKTYKMGQVRMVPAFPCYAFCRFDEYQLPLILSYEHVYHVINVVLQAKFEREVSFVRNVISSGKSLSMGAMKPGDAIEVRHGIYMGQHGKYFRTKKGEQRVEIELETMGQVVTVEVNVDEIEHAV